MVPNRAEYHISAYIWMKVFKNGPNKICGRKPFKKLNRYGLLITSNFLKAVIHKFYLVHSLTPGAVYYQYDIERRGVYHERKKCI